MVGLRGWTVRKDLLAILATLLFTTLWIDFSRIQTNHNGDTFVMSLISLYHWTPLYWEQNRLGMLVPLLATPFHHPLTNLLVQSGIVIFSGMAGFFLLGYYVAGRRRGMMIGVSSLLIFIIGVRLRQQFGYLVYIHQYATSLTLSLLALLALSSWRRAGGWARPLAAVVCIWLALWVNPSLVFVLGPLVLLRRFLLADSAEVFDRSDAGSAALSLAEAMPAAECSLATQRTSVFSRVVTFVRNYPAADWVALGAAFSGLLISMAISKYCSLEQEGYAFLPPREWLACAVGVVRNLPEELDRAWLAAIALVGLSGLATLGWSSGRAAFGRSAKLAAGLLLPALVQFAFMTSLDHVHRSDYGHYIFAAVFLWQGACVAFAVTQWTAVAPDSPRLRAVPAMLLVVFCLVTAARLGRPGIDVVRHAIDDKAGKFTDEILERRCTHVTGDYWRVWSAVFHVNLTLADRGSNQTFWGIAQRCRHTADRWTQTPLSETRIAAILGHEAPVAAYLEHYRVPPVVEVEQGERIRVLIPLESLAVNWPELGPATTTDEISGEERVTAQLVEPGSPDSSVNPIARR